MTISAELPIEESEIQLDFVRASGPGGQNVNKVATAVQLRFNVGASTLALPVRDRLLRLAARRINAAGELVIDAHRFRTQEQNRADALERLAEWIRRASAIPKPRRKTRPSRAAKAQRMESKRRRGQVKGLRGSVRNAE